MALNSEIILTLNELSGCGKKTILAIAEIANNNGVTIDNIEMLCLFWKTLKGSKFEKFSKNDLHEANARAHRILIDSENNNIGVISYFEPNFPKNLKECINENGILDPPVFLFYRGNLKALNKPGVAIIGTRKPTLNGTIAGNYFSREFAKQNFNLVSGLAIGCDTTCHEGALKENGTTTAFLANGLDWDSIYPKENLGLAKSIVENGGLLLSEYSIGQSCNRYALVARDRLQAGLSYATIVIQTGEKGGTMHAVNTTLKADKPLFAVEYNRPEDLNHDMVQGNLLLLKGEKAKAITSKNIDSVLSTIKSAITKETTPNHKDSQF